MLILDYAFFIFVALGIGNFIIAISGWKNKSNFIFNGLIGLGSIAFAIYLGIVYGIKI